MLKFVYLKLSKIKYSGNSIGDDIRVEIELLNQSVHVDKKVKIGTITEIDKEIGRFETDQKLFSAKIRIVVIEKDLLFNDVGSIDSNIKVDTSITKSQQFIYKVQVKETHSILGKVWGKSTATFEITLEATVTDAVKYVVDEGDGWLIVRIESTGENESLPTYLKVKIDYENAQWEKGLYDIEIPDAPHRGRLNDTIKKASTWFRLGHTGDSYLHTGERSLGCITVTEHDRWVEIYSILVKSRKNDSQSVGVLEVID